MPFIDCQPNLIGTVHSSENLAFARDFLTQIIRKHDPSWLSCPKGALGALWMREDTDAVCYLISIANLLSSLSQRVTQSSLEILQDKFNKELLYHGAKQFDETLTELQIAGALSDFVSPLNFEPLVQKNANKNEGKKPSSPDLGIRLPGGDVYIDATVFHLDVLDKWEQSMQIVRDRISKAVREKGLLRSIELRFPLVCKPSDVEKFLPNLIKEITKTEAGSKEIVIAGRKGKAKWHPLLNVPYAQNSLKYPALLAQLIPYEISAAVMGVPSAAIHFAWDLLEKEQDNDDEELLYRSLRNSLRGKRNQFSRGTQNLIAVKLGHYKIVTEGVIRMIEERIWSNHDYHFLSGLILFKPRQGYQESDPENLIELLINPNASCPASHALISLFEKQERYHSEPENSLAYNSLGAMYESQGDLENAIESYRKSLALNSHQPTIHNILGILLADSGDLQSAILEFREAVECDSLFASAYSNLGIAYRRSGNSAAAIFAFKKALKINPDDASVLHNLGTTYALSGNHVEAILMYEKSIMLNPNRAQTYINVGISQVNLGNISIAITNFEQALQIDPDSSQAKQYLTQAKQTKCSKH